MKNLPKQIYLIIDIGGDTLFSEFNKNLDFTELSGITWSENRITENDQVYVLDKYRNEAKFRVAYIWLVAHAGIIVFSFCEIADPFIANYYSFFQLGRLTMVGVVSGISIFITGFVAYSSMWLDNCSCQNKDRVNPLPDDIGLDLWLGIKKASNIGALNSYRRILFYNNANI